MAARPVDGVGPGYELANAYLLNTQLHQLTTEPGADCRVPVVCAVLRKVPGQLKVFLESCFQDADVSDCTLPAATLCAVAS